MGCAGIVWLVNKSLRLAATGRRLQLRNRIRGEDDEKATFAS